MMHMAVAAALILMAGVIGAFPILGLAAVEDGYRVKAAAYWITAAAVAVLALSLTF